MIRFWPWSRFHRLEAKYVRERACRKKLQRRVAKLEEYQRDHNTRKSRREWWITRGGPGVVGITTSVGLLIVAINGYTHWF